MRFSPPPSPYAYRCYAKVNLTLEVLGRRADGYHELVSLAHTISLADELRVRAAEDIVCRAEGLPVQPPGEDLVVQAAKLLRKESRVRAGAELSLLKRIPVAAGLGGGSTDAAAALVALNRLWGTGLHARALERLAAQLGSDVPFFVRGGAAVLRGTGTQLEPMRPLVGQWLCLAVLPHSLGHKTATLYALLEAADYSDGQATYAAAGGLLDEIAPPVDRLKNAFARAARQAFPGLADAWQQAEAACGRPFHLSGSGPALFALAAGRDDAQRLVPAVERLGLRAWAVRTVGRARARLAAD